MVSRFSRFPCRTPHAAHSRCRSAIRNRVARIRIPSSVILALAVLCGAFAFSASGTAATFTVTSTADAGPGSFRAAIVASNAGPEFDRIVFNIPGPGVHTIAPLTPLPTITDETNVDGYSQPGAARSTDEDETNAVLLIELSGENLASGTPPGLAVSADSTAIQGLVINRFAGPQIDIETTATLVYVLGCFIGTNADGTTGAGGAGAASVGVRVAGDRAGIGSEFSLPLGIIIGGGYPTRNIISGNGGHGVHLTGTSTNDTVVSALIGTDRTGQTAIPNGGDGVRLDDSSHARIGVADSEMGNVISGNVANGVHVLGDLADENHIANNEIGTALGGLTALPNGLNGVRVAEGGNVLVGGANDESRNRSPGNVISGNTLAGIELIRTGHPEVSGNLIGLGRNGRTPLGNGAEGVRIEDGGFHLIGGGEQARNVISANGGAGIWLEAYDDYRVLGNYIGVDRSGTRDRGNGDDGVHASAPPFVFTSNVVSGNGGDGVEIDVDPADDIFEETSLIQRNRIGTNAAGQAAIPNDGDGLRLVGVGDANWIGTFQRRGRTAGNVVSGNAGNGITLVDASLCRFGDNFVGTNATGTRALPNGGAGLSIEAGTRRTEVFRHPNVFSGNLGPGIRITGATTADNVIVGARIGTSLDRKRFIPNRSGVAIDGAHDNSVSGSWIAGNRGGGVRVLAGTGNWIRENRLYGNGGLGIDLAPSGPNANDHEDADTGANRLQNHPIITAVGFANGRTIIRGRLHSVPNQRFWVDVYQSDAPRAARAEGRRHLGLDQVKTGPAGGATFRIVARGRWPGDWLRATATRLSTHDTSELGPAKRAP
jgi:Right handed beta helix region